MLLKAVRHLLLTHAYQAEIKDKCNSFLLLTKTTGNGKATFEQSADGIEEELDNCHVDSDNNLDEQPSKGESPIIRRRGPTGGMTDDQVDTALTQICKCSDPFERFARIKEVGAGYIFLLFLITFSAKLNVNPIFRASGTVYISRDLKTSQLVAIKDIDLSKQPKREMILNEIYVMRDIIHDNLVNFLDAYFWADHLWVCVIKNFYNLLTCVKYLQFRW